MQSGKESLGNRSLISSFYERPVTTNLSSFIEKASQSGKESIANARKGIIRTKSGTR